LQLGLTIGHFWVVGVYAARRLALSGLPVPSIPHGFDRNDFVQAEHTIRALEAPIDFPNPDECQQQIPVKTHVTPWRLIGGRSKRLISPPSLPDMCPPRSVPRAKNLCLFSGRLCFDRFLAFHTCSAESSGHVWRAQTQSRSSHMHTS